MERAWLLLSQVMTLGTTWCMFYCILKEKEKKKGQRERRQWIQLAGTLLYLLLPRHIAVVREERNWTQIVIWMVIPVLAASLLEVIYTEKKLWKTGFGLVAVLVIGVIGRMDGVAGLTVLFLVCVAGFCRKHWEYPLIGVLGIVMAYPTYLTWKQWILDGNFAESGFEYTTIMEKGYSIGGLFSTYFYRNGEPGMGILLLGCLIFLIYFGFVKNRKIWSGPDYAWLAAAGLLTVMSLRYFPWDFVQRMGQWSLGLVSLIGTPTVFFTYAQMILCVLSVEKIGDIVMSEEMEDSDDYRKTKGKRESKIA